MRKKESSILLPEKTLEEIVIEMIQYVVDGEVYNPPYISWLSKGQLLWGGNVHWKTAKKYLQKGILKHAGIRKPSQSDLDFQIKRFGYCLEWPEPRCWALTSLMKSEFINKKATGKGFTSIEFLYGRGYIDPKTSKLDPNCSNGITGWFILHSSEDVRDEQLNWIESQPKYIWEQYARCYNTFTDVVQQQIESGNAKAITNSYLLDQSAYKEVMKRLEQNKGKTATISA